MLYHVLFSNTKLFVTCYIMSCHFYFQVRNYLLHVTIHHVMFNCCTPYYVMLLVMLTLHVMPCHLPFHFTSCHVTSIELITKSNFSSLLSLLCLYFITIPSIRMK